MAPAIPGAAFLGITGLRLALAAWRAVLHGCWMIPPGRARLPPIRFVSPERRWRAAFMVPLAAWFGWRAFVYLGPLAGCLMAAGLHGTLRARDLAGSGL